MATVQKFNQSADDLERQEAELTRQIESRRPPRMRYAAQAVEELQKLDPGSRVSEQFIRDLAKAGVIPAVTVGRGKRKRILVNLDALLEYLGCAYLPQEQKRNSLYVPE